MDRSFLFQPEVIAASRQLVNIRLLSYESKSEADLIRLVTPTDSEEAENTVFALVSPDAKRYLSRSGRTAKNVFPHPAEMAATMNRLAKQFPAKTTAGVPDLPKVPSVRLAINVAAADDQPLVLLFAKDSAEIKKLEDQVRILAWSNAFIGKFSYASSSEAKDVSTIDGVRVASGVIVVQPDEFGMKGKVLSQTPASAAPSELEKALRDGASQHKRSALQYAEHIRSGSAGGVLWETLLPITDPLERMARERRPR